MDRDRHADGTQDADWIFAVDDPHSLPTDRLPDRAEFDRYATPLLARRAGGPALPGAENETVDLSDLDLEAPGAPERSAAEPDTATGAIPVLGPEGEEADADAEGADRAGTATAPPAGRGDEALVAPLSRPGAVSYARSGTTPNAEHDEVPPNGFVLPERFAELGVFDALRDLAALICLAAAFTTTFTVAHLPALEIAGRIAIGTGLVALVAVHLLRWVPQTPPLRAVRVLRVAGMLPALLTAVGVVLADLVLSLPVLFASLPDGPPVGIGIGVSLLLLGALLGVEPRAHEGYLPQARARAIARRALVGVAGATAAALLLALVMLIGRVFTTGWAYSLVTFGSTLLSALLLGIVLASALLRERSWYVFSTAVVAALVIAALADNTLGLQFAAPRSAASGFVYLPFLVAAFGLMISRSFVRTMPVSFRRTDWLVYCVRAFELSAVMHAAAVLWHVLAAIAALAGRAPGSPQLHLIDAVVCVCFVVVSLFGRTALLTRPAVSARASGVVAGIVLVVVGFLDVIVNSLAMAAGAGLLTGGVALAIGLAAALMLTVPAPVRDEFGAPDVTRMFADFRARDGGRASLLDQVPDVTAETARRRAFPAR
ncbi:hypothetical protein [Brachybacterium saurashtrense]|uniref:DUF7937 domain-containing protein n=1 Tax=Brachybacterium saurashtrense TaxID=556288 RepID=A0A345YK26_9MICO|nr:hypothetical protein [Brachybacterium saurashtrense]AXK44278.1 hypothetical protein DWV08_00645 [Brachybacterium saurashtrense]RRR21550.1 hypothetical protein DXU92_14545 [Brachybacterium saurashtrense]